MVNKPIRVVRVLEYEYPSYSVMIEDMKRWGVPASGVKQFNPYKAVIWSSLIPAHSGSRSERFAPPTQNWWPGDSCEFLISEDTWVTGKVQTVHLESMSCLVLDSDGAETRVWFKDMRPVESSVTQSTSASAEGDSPERKTARKLLPKTLRGLIETHRENEPVDKSSDEWIDWRRNLSDLTGESEWD